MKLKIGIGMAAVVGIAFSGSVQAALVAEWNFDNQTLTNTGSSGAIHNGVVITGAATNRTAVSAAYSTDTPSGSGYALDLSSTSHYLSITNSSTHDAGYVNTFDAAADFSYSMWVKSTDGTWGSWYEFGGKGSEDNDQGWGMRAKNFTDTTWGGVRTGFYQSPDDHDVSDETLVNAADQTWHLLTFTYSGTTEVLTLYVDGVEKAFRTGAAMLDASSRFLVFGARDDGSRNDNILCDSIQFYDHALAASEVAALYIEQADFFVDSYETELTLYSPETMITGSVTVSYIANTSVDVAVSVSDESHPGAFSLLNDASITLTEPSPDSTVLQFVFNNSVTGLADGESATGLVTVAWNLTGDAEVTEVVLPISVYYGVPAPGPILWDIGIPSSASDIPSTVDDFIAAGVTEDLTGAAASNVEAAQTMSDGGVTVSLSAFAGSYIPGTTYTGAGASIMKEYIYNKGSSVITISGLSTKLEADTEYRLYLWGKGDAAEQTAKFTFEDAEITTSTNDVFTSDAADFMAKFSFTTDLTAADTLTIEWDNVSTYTAFSGLAIVPLLNPNPTVGDVFCEVVSGGTSIALSFYTTSGYLYSIEAAQDLIYGPWSTIASGISGTGSEVTVTNSMPDVSRFYRAFLQD